MASVKTSGNLGWMIGGVILALWSIILGWTGYMAEIALWIPLTATVLFLMLALSLSGGSDGSLVVISLLFIPAWLFAYLVGYSIKSSSYSIIGFSLFLSVCLQYIGFLLCKALDG